MVHKVVGVCVFEGFPRQLFNCLLICLAGVKGWRFGCQPLKDFANCLQGVRGALSLSPALNLTLNPV